MGGKDVLYLRQGDTSYLGPNSIQKVLKDTANTKFKDSADNHDQASQDFCKENEVSLYFFINLDVVDMQFMLETENNYYNKVTRLKVYILV